MYNPWRGVLRYARAGDQVILKVGPKGDKIEKQGVVVSVDDSKEDVDKTKTCIIDCNGRFKRRLSNIRILFQFFFEDRVSHPSTAHVCRLMLVAHE